jgi:hypothetical protein
MNTFSKAVSIVFHPIFISGYFLLILYWLNPVYMDFSERKVAPVIIITFLASTIVFPIIAIFLMKNLGIIQSLEMKDSKERIGPLMATFVFYVWIYLNFKNNDTIPEYVTFFVLGTTISLVISLALSTKYKISLHAAGIAGLTLGLYIIKTKYYFYEVWFTMFGKHIILNANFIIMFLILIMGIIGTTRLHLKAHTSHQVYAGYALGIFSMLMAYSYYF